jgi:hypothetical protein
MRRRINSTKVQIESTDGLPTNQPTNEKPTNQINFKEPTNRFRTSDESTDTPAEKVPITVPTSTTRRLHVNHECTNTSSGDSSKSHRKGSDSFASDKQIESSETNALTNQLTKVLIEFTDGFAYEPNLPTNEMI